MGARFTLMAVMGTLVAFGATDAVSVTGTLATCGFGLAATFSAEFTVSDMLV